MSRYGPRFLIELKRPMAVGCDCPACSRRPPLNTNAPIQATAATAGRLKALSSRTGPACAKSGFGLPIIMKIPPACATLGANKDQCSLILTILCRHSFVSTFTAVKGRGFAAIARIYPATRLFRHYQISQLGCQSDCNRFVGRFEARRFFRSVTVENRVCAAFFTTSKTPKTPAIRYDDCGCRARCRAIAHYKSPRAVPFGIELVFLTYLALRIRAYPASLRAAHRQFAMMTHRNDVCLIFEWRIQRGCAPDCKRHGRLFCSPFLTRDQYGNCSSLPTLYPRSHQSLRQQDHKRIARTPVGSISQ